MTATCFIGIHDAPREARAQIQEFGVGDAGWLAFTNLARADRERAQLTQILDLLAEDSRLNVSAGPS